MNEEKVKERKRIAAERQRQLDALRVMDAAQLKEATRAAQGSLLAKIKERQASIHAALAASAKEELKRLKAEARKAAGMTPEGEEEEQADEDSSEEDEKGEQEADGTAAAVVEPALGIVGDKTGKQAGRGGTGARQDTLQLEGMIAKEEEVVAAAAKLAASTATARNEDSEEESSGSGGDIEKHAAVSGCSSGRSLSALGKGAIANPMVAAGEGDSEDSSSSSESDSDGEVILWFRLL